LEELKSIQERKKTAVLGSREENQDWAKPGEVNRAVETRRDSTGKRREGAGQNIAKVITFGETYNHNFWGPQGQKNKGEKKDHIGPKKEPEIKWKRTKERNNGDG